MSEPKVIHSNPFIFTVMSMGIMGGLIGLIFGVAKYSKLIAAIKAAIQRNNDRNSFVNPLAKAMIPEAIKTINIKQILTSACLFL